MQTINGNSTGPTTAADRIASIDVLRGFALLGILVMNIRTFTMIEAAYFNPRAAGPIEGLDHAVWWLGQLLVDTKFMSLFSMLFGAGVVLMYERRDAAGLRSAGLHYRRMAGLLLIGLCHAYALWYGDILVTYALCGLWLFLLRKRGPVLLITLGVLFLAVGSGLNLLFGLTIDHWPAEAQREIHTMLSPTREMVDAELAMYRGGWLDQMEHRAPMSLFMQTYGYAMWGLWRPGGMMLMGMGLMKLGVLNGKASRGVYLGLVAAGFAVGLPLVAWGLAAYPADMRGTAEYLYLGSQYNYWASVFVALGYVGVIMLACRGGVGRWLSPLAAVGRTALTNYIGQTVICTMLFYGTLHNLGWFGNVSWAAQVGVVAGVWLLQLTASTLWLKRYRMGPLEALWRWGSYGKRPALRAVAKR